MCILYSVIFFYKSYKFFYFFSSSNYRFEVMTTQHFLVSLTGPLNILVHCSFKLNILINYKLHMVRRSKLDFINPQKSILIQNMELKMNISNKKVK